MKIWAIAVLLAVLCIGAVQAESMEPHAVGEGDIVSYVSKEDRTHYIKVGTVCMPEGYIVEKSPNEIGITMTYTFLSDGAEDGLNKVVITGSHKQAEELTDGVLSYMQTVPDCEVSEKSHLDVQGHDAYTYTCTYAYTDEETDSIVYCQNLSYYLQAGNGASLAVHAYRLGEDDSVYLTGDALNAQMEELDKFFRVD